MQKKHFVKYKAILKHMITSCIPKLLLKKIYFFSLQYIIAFDENGKMSFRVNNKRLLKNYNKLWEKVEKLMKIDFESKPVYGDDD